MLLHAAVGCPFSLLLCTNSLYEDTCKLFCFSRLNRHLGYYLLGAIISKTSMSMPRLVFWRTHAIISLAYVLCCELLGL